MTLPRNDGDATPRPGAVPSGPSSPSGKTPDVAPAEVGTTPSGLRKRVPFRDAEADVRHNAGPRRDPQTVKQVRDTLNRLRGSSATAAGREEAQPPGEPVIDWDQAGEPLAPPARKLSNAWDWGEEGSATMPVAPSGPNPPAGSGFGDKAGGKRSRHLGRPGVVLAAVVAGAVLVAVPLLLTGGGKDDSATSVRTDDGIVQQDGDTSSEGDTSVGSPNAASPGQSGTGKHGKTGTPLDTPGKPVARKPSGDPISPAPAPGLPTQDDAGRSGTVGRTSPGSAGSKTPAAPPQGGTSDDHAAGVQIYNHASGRCMAIAGGSGAVSDSGVEIRDCQNVSWQKWTFSPDGSVRSQGKCLNVGGGSTADGARISWVNCNGSGAQHFRLNASYDLVNTQADKCVDVRDKAANSLLRLWSCGGTENQKWSTR